MTADITPQVVPPGPPLSAAITSLLLPIVNLGRVQNTTVAHLVAAIPATIALSRTECAAESATFAGSPLADLLRAVEVAGAMLQQRFDETLAFVRTEVGPLPSSLGWAVENYMYARERLAGALERRGVEHARNLDFAARTLATSQAVRLQNQDGTVTVWPIRQPRNDVSLADDGGDAAD